MDYLISFIDTKRKESNMKKSDLLRAIDLDFKAGYKYLSGERRINRNTLLRICIVFNLSFDEVQDLFLKSFYPQLYPGDSRDYIISEGIKNHELIDNINEQLVKSGFERI